MAQTCQRCRRTNPREANYCYFDGNVLAGRSSDVPADGSAMNLGTRPFSHPLVFPSGEACHNFQQLAEACQHDTALAGDLLQQGHLETFLASQGRMDLAGVARASAKAADRQRGLDDFLGRLPFVLPAGRLQVEPLQVDLGTLRIGEERRFVLNLRNLGMRLVHGTASCDVPWLSLGDGAPCQSRLFQFTDHAVLPVHIVGDKLRAYQQPQETEIHLDTPNVSATVTVRVRVPVQPFPEGALAGAQSPRELAKKAHDAVKEAAALIESGAVARWYQANGWTYPVLGPTASGVAAVQQLFEALGLVKPPRVELSEDAIRLQGKPGDKIEHSIAVITQENRAAIAHGTSDQPWLQVGKTIYRGRSAFLPLTIASVPSRPGEELHAVVAIAANGSQAFQVPVTVSVVGAARPTVPAPAMAARPQPAVPVAKPAMIAPRAAAAPALPAAAAPSGGGAMALSMMFMLIPALLLGAVVIGGAVRDWLVPEPKTIAKLETAVDSTPRLEIRYHKVTQDDLLDTLYLPDHQATMRFGLVTLRKGKEVGAGANVLRLTFDPWGRTNNACLRFDNKDERLFGSGSKGHWLESAVDGWKDDQGQQHDGVMSVWTWDDKKITATQLVELVRGAQSGLLDTCRVVYRIENHDARPHQVGIRFLLDTYIGGNDGVPFTIPGDPELCDTLKDLPAQAKDKKIPDFLQALEKPDLAHPGTIAHLRLRLGNLEDPARVTLGAWPNEKVRVLNKKASGPLTLWDVPLLSLKSLGLDDSAVTIYWKEEPLAPQARREVGFEYGLWNIESHGSQLAATVDGAFRPDGELTVVAYVSRSGQDTDDASVTLEVPPGFKILEGTDAQQVPKLPPGTRPTNVPLTWRVQAGVTGSYEFKVTSSAGMTEALKVEIRKSIY